MSDRNVCSSMSEAERTPDVVVYPDSPCLPLYQHYKDLALEDWRLYTEFNESEHKQRLPCDAHFQLGRKQPKARICPQTVCIADQNRLYIQQHLDSIQVHIPNTADLEQLNSSGKTLVSVTPVAAHGGDQILVHYSLSVNASIVNHIFLTIPLGPLDSKVATFSVGPHKHLSVLACSQGSGCDPLVACLFAFDDNLTSSNLSIFKHNTGETTLNKPGVLRLCQIQSSPVYLSPRSHILPGMLLFYPGSDNKLICFHLHTKKVPDPQPFISEYDLLTDSHKEKMALQPVLEKFGVSHPRFHNAVFSPEANLLVMSFSGISFDSAANLESCAVFIFINPVTYQLLGKVTFPCLYPVKDLACLENKWICYKSYTPVFSTCGEKMAILNYRNSELIVSVMNIPFCPTLQTLCRRIIRKLVRKEDVKKLRLPKILRKYVEFM